MNLRRLTPLARFALILTALFPATTTPLLAQRFEVIDLGTLGGSTSFATGIAQSGTAAGYATNPSSVKHAVLWEDGIVDLGAPDGFIVSEAVAVNESGQAAGNGEGNPQAIQAYLWEKGVWTPLGVLPGRTESIAEDIDSAGRIVGSSLSFGVANSAGFLWEAGVMTDLGTLGGTTRAFGINEAGQVVGGSELILPDSSYARRAFLWEGGLMTNLGVLPGEDFSRAFGVNDMGDVAGTSWHLTSPQFFSANQATLWRNKGAEVIDLGLTPGPESCSGGFPFYTDNVARAVNNLGHVVGDAQCVASGGPLAAFLWEDGVMNNLNDLIPGDSGWDLLSARDINDAGQIVGVGIAPGGDLHAFLLNPSSSSADEGPGTGPDHDPLAARVFPNPFRRTTHISYVLPKPARVRLTVHEVSGRQIATLTDGFLPAGPHAWDWTIDGNAGATLPSGIYLLRIGSDEKVETFKMMLLR